MQLSSAAASPQSAPIASQGALSAGVAQRRRSRMRVRQPGLARLQDAPAGAALTGDRAEFGSRRYPAGSCPRSDYGATAFARFTRPKPNCGLRPALPRWTTAASSFARHAAGPPAVRAAMIAATPATCGTAIDVPDWVR